MQTAPEVGARAQIMSSTGERQRRVREGQLAGDDQQAGRLAEKRSGSTDRGARPVLIRAPESLKEELVRNLPQHLIGTGNDLDPQIAIRRAEDDARALGRWRQSERHQHREREGAKGLERLV